MSTLHTLGQQLAAAMSPELIAPAIAETLASELHAARVTVWQLTPHGNIGFKDIALLALHEIATPQATGAKRKVATKADLFFNVGNKLRLVMSVTHRANVIGRLIVERAKDAIPFSKAEQAEVQQFAEQIGPALHLVIGFNRVVNSREQIVLAREEERRMLRRELHNAIGPSLAALDLRIGALAILARQQPAQPDTLVNQANDSRQHLRNIIADLRRVIYDLRPALLDELGLVAAIQEQALQFSQGPLRVAVLIPQPVPLLPAAVEVAAYKIVIEALSNVARHAEATFAEISLSAQSTQLLINIVDNGKGIAVQQQPGVGLGSMHEIANQLGGHVTASATNGGGTQVHAVIPYKVSSR